MHSIYPTIYVINEVIELFIRYLYFALTSVLIFTALSSFLLSRILIPSKNRRLFIKYLLGIQFSFILISFVTISFFLILGALATLLVFSILLILFLVTEFYLRLITKSQHSGNGIKNRKESARFDSFEAIESIQPHRNAAYLTPEFWQEMQFFTNKGSAKKTRTLDGRTIIDAKDFEGKYISVSGGMRTTTDAPDNPTGRVLLLGGSTVYCFEVPDSLTIASHLQRFLNSSDSTLKVLNLGVSGVTAINRIEKLKSMGTLEKNDIVIILFGDNDVGWQHYYSNEPLLLKVIRNLRQYSRLLAWIYFELSTSKRAETGFSTACETTDRLKKLSVHLDSVGIRHKFVVQPNIYTKKFLNEYESEIVQRFGAEFSQIIRSGYSVYEKLQSDPFASATNLMDGTSASVYLDWGHVNASGNELIAKFVSELNIYKNVQTH